MGQRCAQEFGKTTFLSEALECRYGSRCKGEESDGKRWRPLPKAEADGMSASDPYRPLKESIG